MRIECFIEWGIMNKEPHVTATLVAIPCVRREPHPLIIWLYVVAPEQNGLFANEYT
jgi:hypothetical protein